MQNKACKLQVVFWKTADINCHFFRELRINFFLMTKPFFLPNYFTCFAHHSTALLLTFPSTLLYCPCELYISERKIIETILLRQSKAKSFFQQ